MERNVPPNKPKPKQLSREDRLKAALKANMGRRKAQSRARTASEQADDTGETKKG